MPSAPSSETSVNPIAMGLRFGAAGATAGLGWAAIAKALRARKAEREGTPEAPTSVARPVLAGAMIGMALGTGLGASAWRRKDMTKYSSLLPALEKKALFDSYAATRDAHPWATLAGAFTPGVGAVMSGADAAHSFSKGRWLDGLGNLAMIPAGLIGLKGVLHGIPAMARLAKAGKGTMAGIRAAQPAANSAGAGLRASRGWLSRNVGQPISSAYQAGATRMFQGPLSRMSSQTANKAYSYGDRIGDMIGSGKRFEGLKNVPGLRNLTHFGALGTAAVGLPIADSMMGGENAGA